MMFKFYTNIPGDEKGMFWLVLAVIGIICLPIVWFVIYLFS
jgi:hypothetical protein